MVQNKSDYLREAYRLLADNNTYLKLPSDPFSHYQSELVTLVEAAWKEGILNKQEKHFLLPATHSTPYFYHLLKVHKASFDHPGDQLWLALTVSPVAYWST